MDIINFPTKKYNIIYVDPPWEYGDKLLHRGGSASSHYDEMTIEEICKLPLGSIAADDCLLFCWATWPQLFELPRVFNAWNFQYKTCGFIWIKTYPTGKKVLGQGSYTRGNTEFCLIGRRGSFNRQSGKVSQIVETLEADEFSPVTIQAELKQHSKKPDIIRKKIIELCGDLPRIELFARTKIHGWDTWGNDEKLKQNPLEEFV